MAGFLYATSTALLLLEELHGMAWHGMEWHGMA